MTWSNHVNWYDSRGGNLRCEVQDQLAADNSQTKHNLCKQEQALIIFLKLQELVPQYSMTWHCCFCSCRWATTKYEDTLGFWQFCICFPIFLCKNQKPILCLNRANLISFHHTKTTVLAPCTSWIFLGTWSPYLHRDLCINRCRRFFPSIENGGLL